jgi:signal transduction histidine kinase
VIASNADGVWSHSEASVEFTVSPLYWQTWWFRAVVLVAILLLVMAGYRLRLNLLTQKLNLQFEQRLAERIQVARDIHDTLLQTIQGCKLVTDDLLARAGEELPARNTVEKLSVWLGQAIQEGRLALSSLRSSATQQNDLAEAFLRAGEECRSERAVAFELEVDGTARQLHPIVRDEVYRIGYEAIRNACTHSEGSHVTVQLSYTRGLVLRVRDNGKGIAAEIAINGKAGHFGLIGMRERAARLRAKLTLSSPRGSGTLVELVVPERIAFPRFKRDRPGRFERIKRFFG